MSETRWTCGSDFSSQFVGVKNNNNDSKIVHALLRVSPRRPFSAILLMDGSVPHLTYCIDRCTVQTSETSVGCKQPTMGARRRKLIVILAILSPMAALALVVGQWIPQRNIAPRKDPFSFRLPATRIPASTTTDTSSSTLQNATETAARSKRAPAIPRSAYFLVSDEERLQHNFISFIDHSFVVFPSEPPDRATKLRAPRSISSQHDHCAAHH